MSKCPPSHNKAGARSPADVAPTRGSLVSTGFTTFAEFTRLTGVTLITCLTMSTCIASFKSLPDFKIRIPVVWWETTTVATAGPMVSYLQKKRSSELLKFVRNTGIVPNRTKQLPALPCPPAPPQHRGRPALPSIVGVPPGYSAARLQHMSQHRGSRFPFSGSRTVTSTDHPYTPAPPRSPQLTQPRLRFYRRFPTVSMPSTDAGTRVRPIVHAPTYPKSWGYTRLIFCVMHE